MGQQKQGASRWVSPCAVFLLLYLAAMAEPSNADTVYSTFGLGYSNFAMGITGLYAFPSSPASLEEAVQFTPTRNYNLSQLDLAIIRPFQPGTSEGVVVKLVNDSGGGSPGNTIFESWTVANPPDWSSNSQPPVSLVPASSLQLLAGQTYWIVASPLAPTSFSGWIAAKNGYLPFAYHTSTPSIDSGWSIFDLEWGGGGALLYDVLGTPSGPASPTNLKATQIGNSGTQIQLTWDYGTDPIDGFIVERQTPSEGQVATWECVSGPACVSGLASAGPPGHWYLIDTSVNAYATYKYRVRAYKGGVESDNSNAATCFQVNVFVLQQPFIDATFSPDLAAALPSPLDSVAQILGYDHFNWINWVEYSPSNLVWTDLKGLTYTAPPRFFDPPKGGWNYWPNPLPADDLVFYWNEQGGLSPDYTLCGPASRCRARDLTTLKFEDAPGDERLIQVRSDQFIAFTTELVGVHANGTFDVLHNFTWTSDFKPLSGTGGVIFRSFNLENLAGSGGIFNIRQDVSNNDLPADLRQVLIQLGAGNISSAPKVDKDAPMTAAFFSGPQGTSGWYTGPVTVTLIATDIDGPSDVAGTHYQVDGGLTNNYTGPFIVPADGTHTIQFGSADQAGNVETPSPSVGLKIDSTPPLIRSSITGTQGNNGWYRSNVTVTWGVIDAISGIASSSGCAQTTLTTDTTGITLNCTATNGAGLSTSASVTIKIDQTPPVASATLTPAANANGWNNTNTTVTYTGTDNLSGIDFCSTAITLTNEGAGQTAAGTCTDKAGNVSAPATARVNIDETPPVVSGMPTGSCSLWPPNGKLVKIAVVTASDALSGLAPGSFNVTGTSSEPASDPKSPDIVISPNGTGGFVVQLRADRSGNGNGRIYSLTATANDLAGNATTVTASCTVPHDQGKK